MRNKNSSEKIINDLQLEIILEGSYFDGNLNFGAVAVDFNNNVYMLDITDTTGYKGENVAGIKDTEYLLTCKFESDIDEIKNVFGDCVEAYDFNYDTCDFKSSKISARTNLAFDCEPESLEHNLNRVVSITLVSHSIENVKIPVVLDESM